MWEKISRGGREGVLKIEVDPLEAVLYPMVERGCHWGDFTDILIVGNVPSPVARTFTIIKL